MGLDSTLTAGLIGAGAMLVLGAIPFFIGWGSIHATLDGLKARMSEAERELSQIDQIRADVSYIRGVLDGEARAAREARGHL
jgi:hypothetical protein